MATAANNQMVMDNNAQGFTSNYNIARQRHIGATGLGVATGVIVNQNQTRRAVAESTGDDFAHIYRRLVNGTTLLNLVMDQPVLCV